MKIAPLALLALLCAALCSCSNEPPKDPLLKQAEAGDGYAQLDWARKLMESPESREEAIDWYRKSSDNGIVDAQRELGILLLSKEFGSRAIDEGRRLLEELAAKDDTASLRELGVFVFESGENKADKELAYSYFERAATKGDPHARYRILTRDWNALEDKTDRDVLRKFKARAYDIGTAGEPLAYGIMGVILDDEGKVEEAEKWFFEASLAGDPYSMYRTGLAYHRYIRDPAYGPLGFEMLSKAEKAGVQEALWALGKAYYQGNGTGIQREKAFNIGRIAALRGDANAAAFLATIMAADKDWSFEECIDYATIEIQSDDNGKGVSVFRRRNPHTGFAFEDLVQQRYEQLKLYVNAYQAGDFETTTPPSMDEIWSQYGDDADLLVEAIKEPKAELSYQMAMNYLNSEKEYANQKIGFEWLHNSILQNHPFAAITAFERFDEYGFDRYATPTTIILALQSCAQIGNTDAALILAREYQEGDFVEKSEAHVLTYALMAYENGETEGKAIASELLATGRYADFSNEIQAPILEELADSGNLELRYKRAEHLIFEYLDFQVNTIKPNSRMIVEEITQKTIANTTIGSYSGLYNSKVAERTKPDAFNAEAKAAVNEIVELAELGHPIAKRNAAMWKIAGDYLEKDPDTGVRWLEEVVEQSEDADAHFCYANILYHGYRVESDVVLASKHMRKSAELGHELAKSFFTDLRSSRKFEDTPIGLAYRAIERNDDEAMLGLARYFKYSTKFDEKRSNSEYMKWMSAAAKNDNIEALTTIGLAYMRGSDVERNPMRGMRFLERCADLGDATSQYYYAFFLITGVEVEADVSKAAGYLRMAADQGHRRARQLIKDIQTSFPGRELSDLAQEDIGSFVVASINEHDTFPVSPRLVAKNGLRRIVDVSRNLPIYAYNGDALTGQTRHVPIFLAADAFHPTRLNITKVQVDAPMRVHDNAVVFTGLDPAISFFAQTEKQIDDVYCLLLVRTGRNRVEFEWKALGTIKPGKGRRIRFAMESSFTRLEDVAPLFFSGNKEIATDLRIQPNHFIDQTLSEFTEKRFDYLDMLEGDADPKLYRKISSYIYGTVNFPEDSHATFDVNEFGFVKGISYSDTIPFDEMKKLLHHLTSLTFYPRVKDGEATGSKIKVPLKERPL